MRKFVLVAIILMVLFVAVPIASVFGDISVGVKKSDWIQYNTHVTGNPPEDHNMQLASMNVTNVEGTAISLDIQTLYNNGTLYPEHITLNLATGVLGDDFFIPKILNVGDQFYDSHQGNITITSIQQRVVAGAQRTVVSGATNYTTYFWDRETGAFVAASSIEPDYTIVTNANATNMWQPDIAGLQPALFYRVIVVVAIVAVVLSVITAIWVRRRKQRTLLLTLEVVGAVFVAVFLSAYLGGMLMTPSTTVLHSEPAFRIPLFIFGVALLILILGNVLMALLEKSPLKSASPLKMGLLIVAFSYFLFTLHAMFTLSWIGEWEPLGGSFGFTIFVEDISATIGLIFRFAASIIALAAIIFYFSKKKISKPAAYKILRVILVFEGIYWLGLIATAGFSVQSFGQMLLRGRPLSILLNFLLVSVIPTVFESVILPIALFILAFKLNPSKPLKSGIKWAPITGTTYIAVFWLINMSIWLGIVQQKGTEYLTAYPEHLLSYILTIVCLLALIIYTVYFTKKSSRTETLQELKLRTIGGIILALGMYFLWNYLSWVILAGYTWNYWYAWFLGHNMDLWLLSLPLVGLPLLFYRKPTKPDDPNNKDT